MTGIFYIIASIVLVIAIIAVSVWLLTRRKKEPVSTPEVKPPPVGGRNYFKSKLAQSKRNLDATKQQRVIPKSNNIKRTHGIMKS